MRNLFKHFYWKQPGWYGVCRDKDSLAFVYVADWMTPRPVAQIRANYLGVCLYRRYDEPPVHSFTQVIWSN